MKNILSIDVEDWFHILEVTSVPDVSQWAGQESRVEQNLYRMFDELDKRQVKATCFFLGWIAEKFPHLVKETYKRGHEIASHGYAHQLLYSLSPDSFREDIRKSKSILEDLTGAPVNGYRAPGFSLTKDTLWAFPILCEEGYTYSSSVFPASRGHGGIPEANMAPYVIPTDAGPLVEFPVSVASLFKKRICFFGGGYLRLFPYYLIRYMSYQVNREGRPVIYYLHPREIDPEHPRLPMPGIRRFKSYVNLHTTMPKLQRLLTDQQFLSFQQWIDSYPVVS